MGSLAGTGRLGSQLKRGSLSCPLIERLSLTAVDRGAHWHSRPSLAGRVWLSGARLEDGFPEWKIAGLPINQILTIDKETERAVRARRPLGVQQTDRDQLNGCLR